MTTKWEVPRLWEGQTIAILACGSGMDQELADTVRHLPRIAVKRAYLLAPDAEILVGIDGSADADFWAESRDFAGLRVCGVECDLDTFCLHLPHEVVTLGEGHVIHIRNNLLFAMRIAAMAGASKILLLGVDTEAYEAKYDCRGLTQGLAALETELRAQGVEVERVA